MAQRYLDVMRLRTQGKLGIYVSVVQAGRVTAGDSVSVV